MTDLMAVLLGMGALVLGYLLFDDLRVRAIVTQQQKIIATQQREVEFLRDTLMRYFEREKAHAESSERRELLSAVIAELQSARGVSIFGASVSAADVIGGGKTHTGV